MKAKTWLPYLRKSLYILAVLMLIALLIYLKNQHNQQACKEIDIRIIVPEDKKLIAEESIQDYLNTWYPGGLVGLEIGTINIADIESRIEELEAVNNVEVSFQLDGELRIEIDQRIPIVRIYENENRSYYLDNKNKKIASMGLQPARVPIASGALSAVMIEKIYTLSTYVQENPFAEALCEQIFVTNDGELILIPKISSQQIIIGEPVDLEEKFHKLEKFYKHGLNSLGWDKYKTINLSFENQIVCN